MKYLNKVVVGLVFVLFAGAAQVLACSCLPARSVADSVDGSDVVARVRLDRITDLPAAAAPSSYGMTAKKAVMRVEKVFKGGLVEGQTIDVAQGDEAACFSVFSEENRSQEFLLYMNDADADTKLYMVSICGRSRRISGATADLKYLERRAELAGKTMIAGVAHGTGGRGVTVTVRGGGRTYRRKTDKDGYFEIVEPRPGQYTLSVAGKMRYVYVAPSGPRNFGGYVTPKDGKFAAEVTAGRMTEIGIYFE